MLDLTVFSFPAGATLVLWAATFWWFRSVGRSQDTRTWTNYIEDIRAINQYNAHLMAAIVIFFGFTDLQARSQLSNEGLMMLLIAFTTGALSMLFFPIRKRRNEPATASDQARGGPGRPVHRYWSGAVLASQATLVFAVSGIWAIIERHEGALLSLLLDGYHLPDVPSTSNSTFESTLRQPGAISPPPARLNRTLLPIARGRESLHARGCVYVARWRAADGYPRNQPVLTQVDRNMRCISARWGLAVAVMVAACTQSEPTTTPGPGSVEPKSDRVTQIPLPRSGYVYDAAVTEGAVWVTSRAGLFRVDLANVEATNVLPRDDLFRAEPGHGVLWVSTGSGGQVLRIDPTTSSVTAEIDIGAGPVTHLAMSEDAVWVSAVSDLVRIDPATNEVVRRLRSERGFGDVAIGEEGLWVVAGANQEGAVWRIDPATAEVQQKIPLPNPSFWNELESEDGAIWVTSSPTVHENGASFVRLYRIDPSTSEITAEVPLGDGPTGLGPGDRAASLATLAVGEGYVWALVDSESLLLRIDSDDLSVSETLEGAPGSSSDVGSGMAVGAGAIWITAPHTLTRISVRG